MPCASVSILSRRLPHARLMFMSLRTLAAYAGFGFEHEAVLHAAKLAAAAHLRSEETDFGNLPFFALENGLTDLESA